MSVARKKVVTALKAELAPRLRERGFTGSFPHFRRIGVSRIDLLSVSFDRSGDGFFVEIAKCNRDGIATRSGEHIPPSRVRAWDVYPPNRPRLGFTSSGGSGVWFKFDDEALVTDIAQTVIQYLPEADQWWTS